MSRSKKVIVNSIIYSCSGLLLKCFTFFLLPLYTAYLTTEDYGIISVANSFITTMSFVIAFSLFSAVMRFYVDYKEQPVKLKRFYGTISTFVFLSGFIFLVIATIFKDILSEYLFGGLDFYPIVAVTILSLIFNCQHNIFDKILRSQQLALKSSVASIMFFLATVVLNILFVVLLKMGALGSLLATMIATIMYTIYFVVEMLDKKTISFCLDFGLLKEALKYSIPIMPHNLSTQITVLVSKIFIGDVVSLASLGLYSIAAQFGNLADTVQGYVSAAYGPWLYEKLHSRELDYKVTINRTVNMLSSVIGLIFVIIALFSYDYIVLMINKNYAEAWKYVPLIVLVFTIKIIYYFYVEILFYYKKASRLLFTATLTSSFLNITLTILLISPLGIYGSILADAISMFIRCFIIVWLSKEFENIGLKVKVFVKNFFVVTFFIFMGFIPVLTGLVSGFSFLNFLYKIIVVCAFIIFILYTHKDELINLFNVLKSRVSRKVWS